MKKTVKLILPTLLATIVLILNSNRINAQDFSDFVKEFIADGTASSESFKTFSENKISTIDENGDATNESPSKAFKYLKYFFEFHKFLVKESAIFFSDGEYIVGLYFHLNESGEWKLYKYSAEL